MKWTEKNLGDIVANNCGLIQTGPFGSQLHQSDYVEEGTPVVMPTDIVDGRIAIDGIARVTEGTADRLARHKLVPRVIVLPRRGEITKRAFVRGPEEGWLCGSGCLQIDVRGTDVAPEFLYYYMAQSHVGQWLEQHAVGSTMLNLSAGIVNQMPVHYPEYRDQQAIASILTAYDDLIENNRRRMALLEEAARKLYREWFVHLRFPGHEESLKEERRRMKGGIPEGWERKTLGEVAEINKANLPKSFDAEIEYIDISAVTPGRINETTRYQLSDAPSRARRIVQHGDILWSCVRPNRKSYAVVWNPGENLIASTGFVVITPDGVPTSFLEQATTTDDFVRYLENNAKGAAYPAVLASDFERAELLIPTRSLLKSFASFAEPLLDQRHNLEAQTRNLRFARDRLLPKLMSGEIEV